jgi:hypothetical protein
MSQPKLSEHDIDSIRILNEHGTTPNELASKYGVNPSTISRILRNVSWKKVPKTLRNVGGGVAGAPIGVVTASKIRVPKGGLKVAWVTDTQCRDGVPLEHLMWCGDYLARKRPDVIMLAGDWWDMPSLNEHSSKVERATNKHTYIKDVDAGRRGMEMFLNPIERVSGWNPYRLFTYGNHEYRGVRAVLEDPRLADLICADKFGLETDYGFKTYPFLQPVEVGGVAFCHYFPSGVMGKPITTASNLLSKYHMSACAGHQQGRDIAYSKRADGSNMTAIISGSFYQHDEDYLSPFTNKHWRGMYMLHEVEGGSFDEMAVSINFLKRKFKERR